MRWLLPSHSMTACKRATSASGTTMSASELRPNVMREASSATRISSWPRR